ncbi:hypothetical protein ACJQWK_08585 [Exserohilum turcicum]
MFIQAIILAVYPGQLVVQAMPHIDRSPIPPDEIYGLQVTQAWFPDSTHKGFMFQGGGNSTSE